MLEYVTFTGWDHHTDLAELQEFLDRVPQQHVEIAVLFSMARSANGDDRYPNPIQAAEIFRTAKAAGQRTALHLCGAVARNLLNSADDEQVSFEWPVVDLVHLADRVQVNVSELFWQESGRSKYKRAFQAAHAMGRPCVVQTRAATMWPDIEHFAPRATRMVPFLFDRSAGNGLPLQEYPEPPPGRLVGYAGGLGPDNVGSLVRQLSGYEGTRFWVDMESGIRESMSAFPGGPRGEADQPQPTFVSLAKCARVMAAVEPFMEGRR